MSSPDCEMAAMFTDSEPEENDEGQDDAEGQDDTEA